MSEDEFNINDHIARVATEALLPQLQEMMRLAIEKAYNDLYPPRVIQFNADCFGVDDIERILSMWREDSGHCNSVQALQILPDYEAMWNDLKKCARDETVSTAVWDTLWALIDLIEKAHTPAELLTEDGEKTEGGE